MLSRLLVVVGFGLVLAGPAIAGEPFGGALGARRACEKALESEAAGQKVDSRYPCNTAMRFGNQPEDQRNEIASMLSDRQVATLDDLAVASMLADSAVQRDPGGPWGYLARCDIARRIGSAEVMKTCLRDLQRVAPDHPETLRMLARSTVSVPAWVWIVRALLVLALLGTLAHAAAGTRRRLRERRAAVARPVLAFFVVVASIAGGTSPVVMAAQDEASAQQSLPPPPGARGPQGDLSTFRIDDADPEKSVPTVEQQNKRPLQFGYFIQDLTDRAAAAMKKGNHAAAARYYTALSNAAPEVAVGPRKLCASLEAAGDLTRAVQACRTALIRKGATLGDFHRFISIVLAQPGPLPKGEKEELDNVLKHLEANTTTVDATAPTLRCEVGLRFSDIPMLEACTSALEKLAPNDPKTVSFAWALAVAKQDRAGAMRLIDRAKGIGVPQTGLQQMEQATSAMSRKRIGRFVAWAAAAALLALSLRHGLRWLAARRRVAA